MNIQSFFVKYIIVHIIPQHDWALYTYQQKKKFHYIITVSGKVIPVKPLASEDGTIEVIYAGSEAYANNSEALFSLLFDLWVKHQEAKIVYAKDLFNTTSKQMLIDASHWLMQHMPTWLQRKLPNYNNLLTLRSLLPIF